MKKNQTNLGIYIHLPFCATICPYCDFYKIPYDFHLEKKYIKALIEEIEFTSTEGYIIDTIYFGGGTPSISARYLPQIMSSLKTFHNISTTAEISCEANPCSLNDYTINFIKESGINRISIGIQSFDQNNLKSLGRTHTNDTVISAISNVRKFGINNISIDILIGSPSQNISHINTYMEYIKEINPQHLSAYILQVEKNTPFNNPAIIKSIPNDDKIYEIYITTVGSLDKLGLSQYEISNFSKPRFKSKHNLKYWSGKEYIGFGVSSHSFFMGSRYKNILDISGYMSSPLQNKIITDSSPNSLHEYIIFRLRLVTGIKISRINSYIKNFEKFYIHLENLKHSKLINKFDLIISLTPKGFLISNQIINSILKFIE
ncbi:MAG: radical SAM family heme chaperone HemW [Oscillospiraceae bacterium]|nr:radical SAM family heme chaperone HemW [Oscillospiraceae bacterium]